jgi:DNA repair photolyase
MQQTGCSQILPTSIDVCEIEVKTGLVRSRVPGVDYVINPYLGCGHGCLYCYAVFMRKYSRYHANARWGSFVECKANIVELLRRELSRRKKRGSVLLSSVCDPYQPVEGQSRLTRGCLEVLREHNWEVEILTRSPLVVRDLETLTTMPQVSVGFSIGTDNELVRGVLEPGAPPILSRVEALKELHNAGIATWVFIAPMLPMDPRKLHEMVAPHVDSVLLDTLNYREQVRQVFITNDWGYALTDDYARETSGRLMELFGEQARQV